MRIKKTRKWWRPAWNVGIGKSAPNSTARPGTRFRHRFGRWLCRFPASTRNAGRPRAAPKSSAQGLGRDGDTAGRLLGQTSQARAAAPAPRNLGAAPVERNPASARAEAYAEAGDAVSAEIAAAAAIERRNRAMNLERRLARQAFYDAAPAGHKLRNTQNLNVKLSCPARS